MITFEAGLLVRGKVRRELEKAKYLGEVDDFKEIKGVFESEFLIKNPNADVVNWLRIIDRQFVEG